MKLIMKLAFVNSNKPNALSAFFAKKKNKNIPLMHFPSGQQYPIDV